MNARDEFFCTDTEGERREADGEALERLMADILSDDQRMRDIDLEVTNKFDGEVVDHFSILCDIRDSGLIQTLAYGGTVESASSLAQEAFARLAKFAEQASDLRAAALLSTAESEL